MNIIELAAITIGYNPIKYNIACIILLIMQIIITYFTFNNFITDTNIILTIMY